MGKPKVVVIGDMDKSLLNMISKQSDLKIWDKADPIPRDMLFEWLEDAEGLISRGDVKVDDELLSNSTNLKVIAQSSVGLITLMFMLVQSTPFLLEILQVFW